MTIYNVQRYEKFEKDDPMGDGMVLWEYRECVERSNPGMITKIPRTYFVGQAQRGPQMFKFPIKDVSTVEEAFERFQACAEVHVEVIKKQARDAVTKQLLATPGQMPPKNGKIIGLRG